MKRQFTINYQCTNDSGQVRDWTAFRTFDSKEDQSELLKKEYSEEYKNDSSFKLISIIAEPTGDIDWDLLARMRATRDMCELGHKVRAEAKIKNRQPLRNAYVIFSDYNIQDYMIYLDGIKKEYESILGNELNVLNVYFIEGSADRFFNYNLKPNFKVLGPKGFGKQAQDLKKYLAEMDIDDRNNLYFKLKAGGSENILGIDLVHDDLEIEFLSKENYMSSTGKVGAIILDTNLDEDLLERGFVAEFRSTIQNLRKTINLGLTDKISLELFCDPKPASIIEKNLKKLTKDLLATEINFFPPEQVDKSLAHEILIDKETYFINIYKELIT